MSDALWEYAKKPNEDGDPDSCGVRELAQRHEGDSAFQGVIARLNDLHEFQAELAGDGIEKKASRKRESRS